MILLGTSEFSSYVGDFGFGLGVFRTVFECCEAIDTSCYNEMYNFFRNSLKKHKHLVSASLNYFMLGTGNVVSDACCMLFAISPDLNAEVYQLDTGLETPYIRKVFLPSAGNLPSSVDKSWLEIKQLQQKFVVDN